MTTARTLVVHAQAKLGALDRVLGALTHRGIIPTQFQTVLLADQKTLRIESEFHLEDDHVMRKLCKFLDRQVYILTVEDASESPVCDPLGISFPPFPKVQVLEKEALSA
jgi:acetolactate synthase small subunit